MQIATSIETRFRVIELQPRHVEKYVRLIGTELGSPDFLTPDEHRQFKRTHRFFRSWLVVARDDPDEWIAWTASGFPSPYLSTAVENYGTVVLPRYRGQGISKLIDAWRATVFPGKDLIGTAQPTNIVSMNLLITTGYRPYMFDDPWIVFLKRAVPESGDRPVRTPAG